MVQLVVMLAGSTIVGMLCGGTMFSATDRRSAWLHEHISSKQTMADTVTMAIAEGPTRRDLIKGLCTYGRVPALE